MWLDSKIELTKDGKMIDESKSTISAYMPANDARDLINTIRFDFMLADQIMQKPRREFNDLSLLQRNSVDLMTWNTYQPNDGDSLDSSDADSWKSNAVRPVTRNKVIAIAAKTTARLIYPHMFAFDKDSNEQEDAAQAMNDLFEWTTQNQTSTYMESSIHSVLSALVAPAAIVYTEHAEVYRQTKTGVVLDEDMSGFREEVVPVDQLYIADFYEPDIQRQRFLIWRRVRDYTLVKERWGDCPDFQYVKPGVMILYNDANQSFYETYDAEMRPYEVEEILYWNKHLNMFQVVVNGVLLTDVNNANPREDGLYPFAKFYFEPISPQNRCFYGKSMVFKNMPDDKVINTLYPMVMDGTYLALMPPQMVTGGEIIGSDVMIPGAVTTLQSPDASVTPLLTTSQNLKAAYDAMLEINKSMDESTISSQQQGLMPPGQGTAYEISKIEANAQQMLGLFTKMETMYVKQFSRLRIGDIKQYLTLPEVLTIEGSDNTQLVYKTFMLSDKHATGHTGTRKVKFTLDHPTGMMSEHDKLNYSYQLLAELGKNKKDTLTTAHPQAFRALNYMAIVSPDVVSPMTEEMERAFDLEQYDRMFQNPIFDPEETGRLLLTAYDRTKKNPDKYIAKQQPQQPGIQPPQPPPGAGNVPSPVGQMVKQTPGGAKPLVPR